MANSKRTDSERRDFLKAAAGGVLFLKPQNAFGYQANSTVEVGLVGCGGRGNWLAPFFREHADARVVAVADVVKTNLESTRQKFQVEPSRAYHGPDAFRELANSRLDAVAIETPTYFHPMQAAAAVDAGKHVYCAKPIAVDVPSSKDFLQAGQKAQGKNLSFWVDFQSRARPVFQEAVARMKRGDIGKIAFAQVFYYAGRPWKDRSTPGMNPGLKRIMHWFGDRALSGDIIVEQNIHVIDMANWYIGSHPLKAHGAGGRTDWSGTQNDMGDAWDHFAVTYWYPDDVHASFSSSQLTGKLNDLCVRCFGVRGCADTHYGGMVRIASDGNQVWTGSEKDDTFTGGAIANVRTFVDSIRAGKPVNNAATAVESNLTGIIGRTAAYQQRTVSWEEMLASTERWDVNLDLNW